MKKLLLLALATSASAALVGSAANASPVIDGKISPGEYTGATVTTTPYSPGADVTLATFGSGNENVSETVYYQADPNGKGLDIAIKTNPAGVGLDKADASVGDQFTNLYFDDPAIGKYLGFELGNHDVFNPLNGTSFTYDAAALGILYVDTPGTIYASGGLASVSEAYIPFTAFNTLLGDLGLPADTPGEAIQLRDIQAFSYAGNNGNPVPAPGGGTIPSRFGVVSFAAAVPEPSAWLLMLMGVGAIGVVLRRARNLARSFAMAAKI